MKVLRVTGSSRGIGAEICRQAAAEGWKVCINYANSEDEADRVVAEIANGAMFLLSDKSSYATGAILDVCGGWVSP